MFDAEETVKRILKLVLISIGSLVALCLVGGIVCSGQKEARDAERMAAAEKQAADTKAKADKAKAALRPELTGDALVAACADAAKAGGIPAEHGARCGDAILAAGQAALTANRPADAVALLEQAEKVTLKKDEVKAVLADAKAAVAVEAATFQLKRAEEAWAAKDYAKALAASGFAQKAIADGLHERSDDATLKGLATKLEPVLKRATERAQAGEVVKRAGDYDYEYSNGALVVTANYETDGDYGDILVSGHQALKLMAEEGFDKAPGLQSITIIEKRSYNDARGNKAEAKKVAELKVTRKNAKTIGWDNITAPKLYKLLDKAWVAPGVHIEDAL